MEAAEVTDETPELDQLNGYGDDEDDAAEADDLDEADGFDEDDEYWARLLHSWAEEQGVTALPESRDLANGLLKEVAGGTGGDQRIDGPAGQHAGDAERGERVGRCLEKRGFQRPR